MRDTLTCKRTLDDPNPTSAFQQFGTLDQRPVSKGHSMRKRDSGYGSDFSPASVSSTLNRKFLKKENENVEVDFDVFEALIPMNDLTLGDDNVFVDSFDAMFNVITECDEDEDIDKEVETFLTNTQEKNVQKLDTSRPQRPSAPIPQHRDVATIQINNHGDSDIISSTSYHTCWKLRGRHLQRYAIPSAKRSVGIQTPSPPCQLMKVASPSPSSSRNFENWSQSYSGEAIVRTRMHSERTNSYSFLPDIVLTSRDRSISLPDVQAFRRREQQHCMGRELRRISDDFQSSYLSKKSRNSVKRRGNFIEQPRQLFPFRICIDLNSYWQTFRRILTSNQFFPVWSEHDDDCLMQDVSQDCYQKISSNSLCYEK